MPGDSLAVTSGSQPNNQSGRWWRRLFGRSEANIEHKPDPKPATDRSPKPSEDKDAFYDPVTQVREEPVVKDAAPPEGAAVGTEGASKPVHEGDVLPPPPPTPAPPKKSSSPVRTKAIPPLVVGDLSVGLVNISKQVIALPGGQYDVGPLVYTLFRSDKDFLRRVCEHLAHPYVELGEKKVEMVIGMGAYGGFLAKGLATFLPLVGEYPVGDLPIEKDPEKGWHFASDEMAAEELKAKAVLLVVPALTPSTLSDVEACLQLLRLSKEKGGIGGNVHVVGVATPFMFNCKPEIKNGCVSLVVTNLHSSNVVMDLPPKK